MTEVDNPAIVNLEIPEQVENQAAKADNVITGYMVQAAEADAIFMNQGARTVGLFTKWFHDQHNPAEFLASIARLDDESRVSLADSPVQTICEILMDDPIELAEMMYAVTTQRFHRAKAIEAVLRGELEGHRQLNEEQAKVIRKLRKLVAPSKLKKFDAEQKANEK